MDLETFRRHCLSLPHVTEDVQWQNDLLFRIGGKIFAVAVLDSHPLRVSFKCDPETFHELSERPSIVPAPYLARHHWVLLERPDALPAAELKRHVRESYRMVRARLPAKVRNRLDPD